MDIDGLLERFSQPLFGVSVAAIFLIFITCFIIIFEHYPSTAIILFTLGMVVLLLLSYLCFLNFVEERKVPPAGFDPAKAKMDAEIASKPGDEDQEVVFSFLINTKQDTTEQYRRLLRLLGDMLNAGSGIAYMHTSKGTFMPVAGYALPADKEVEDFNSGEGLSGQAVINKEPIIITDVPESYVYIQSGLGKHVPVCLLFIPILHKSNVVGLIELQSFNVPETEYVRGICKKVSTVLEKNNILLNL